jgi:hypothetical protein
MVLSDKDELKQHEEIIMELLDNEQILQIEIDEQDEEDGMVEVDRMLRIVLEWILMVDEVELDMYTLQVQLVIILYEYY